MDILSISVFFLWIVVFALVLVVLALARQIGVLFERVAPAGALMVNQQLTVGNPAPKIVIESLAGHQLETGQANQLLFFASPSCPICKSLFPVLKDLRRENRGMQFVLLSDGDTKDAHRRMVEEEKLSEFEYALSEAVGRSYGVSKLPFAVLIDERGLVASFGIVNSREHLESLFVAERLGVANVQDYLSRNDKSKENQSETSVLP